MKEAQYTRKNHIISDVDGNVVFEGKTNGVSSINAAKRESRRLQLDADGKLGLGTLRVRS